MQIEKAWVPAGAYYALRGSLKCASLVVGPLYGQRMIKLSEGMSVYTESDVVVTVCTHNGLAAYYKFLDMITEDKPSVEVSGKSGDKVTSVKVIPSPDGLGRAPGFHDTLIVFAGTTERPLACTTTFADLNQWCKKL